jgi:hypothetical protein
MKCFLRTKHSVSYKKRCSFEICLKSVLKRACSGEALVSEKMIVFMRDNMKRIVKVSD